MFILEIKFREDIINKEVSEGELQVKVKPWKSMLGVKSFGTGSN